MSVYKLFFLDEAWKAQTLWKSSIVSNGIYIQLYFKVDNHMI